MYSVNVKVAAGGGSRGMWLLGSGCSIGWVHSGGNFSSKWNAKNRKEG